jgi:hypothetical protein
MNGTLSHKVQTLWPLLAVNPQNRVTNYDLCTLGTVIGNLTGTTIELVFQLHVSVCVCVCVCV